MVQCSNIDWQFPRDTCRFKFSLRYLALHSDELPPLICYSDGKKKYITACIVKGLKNQLSWKALFLLFCFQVLFHRAGRPGLGLHLLADEQDPINPHELYIGNIFVKGIPLACQLAGNLKREECCICKRPDLNAYHWKTNVTSFPCEKLHPMIVCSSLWSSSMYWLYIFSFLNQAKNEENELR